jgi:hypothetical protein
VPAAVDPREEQTLAVLQALKVRIQFLFFSGPQICLFVILL